MSAANPRVLIVGPANSGKTTLADQLLAEDYAGWDVFRCYDWNLFDRDRQVVAGKIVYAEWFEVTLQELLKVTEHACIITCYDLGLLRDCAVVERFTRIFVRKHSMPRTFVFSYDMPTFTRPPELHPAERLRDMHRPRGLDESKLRRVARLLEKKLPLPAVEQIVAMLFYQALRDNGCECVCKGQRIQPKPADYGLAGWQLPTA